LRDRARRIVALVTGTSPEAADALLERARWNVKAAIVMGKAGLSRAAAIKRLRDADDFVREAIGEELEPAFRRRTGPDAPDRR
jgi:N-acetylmuramic acid 6-phosphate etherase